MTDPMLVRMEGPSPVHEIGIDLVKRGLIVAPLLIAIGALFGGAAGAASVAYGLAIVLFNFWLSAATITFTARISLALMMGGVLFGFLIRLAIIFVAVWLVKDAAWINLVALGVTIIITHLGLLGWELRHVSATLAYPGLKPKEAV
jgi:hypothetical protein